MPSLRHCDVPIGSDQRQDYCHHREIEAVDHRDQEADEHVQILVGTNCAARSVSRHERCMICLRKSRDGRVLPPLVRLKGSSWRHSDAPSSLIASPFILGLRIMLSTRAASRFHSLSYPGRSRKFLRPHQSARVSIHARTSAILNRGLGILPRITSNSFGKPAARSRRLAIDHAPRRARCARNPRQ